MPLRFQPVSYILILPFLIACSAHKTDTEKSTQPDSTSAKLGQVIFTENCSTCHNFKQDGIGPQLGGITSVVSADWVKRFIKDPKAIVESGDERASRLHEEFKTIMPPFPQYSDEELNGIIAFLSTHKAPPGKNIIDPNALKDPIPETIPMSDLVIEMEEVTQIPPSSDQGQLTRICKLDTKPGTNDLFIVDLRGRLYQLVNNQPVLYLDMANEFPSFIDKPGLATGFGSFAFHPDFRTNGLLYTSHTEAPGSGVADFSYADSIKVMLQWVLTEWKTDQPDAIPFKGKGRELLRINMVHSYHGIQEVTFNPLAKPGDKDYGLLYIGIGDGSSVEFGYPFLAHSQEKIWGTIIRIDPAGKNSKNGKYGIPQTNPFVNAGDPNTLGEIYAYGFRNPHRISWTKSGQIIASNIGHHNIESLNLILPGHDYGWPIREGGFLMDLSKGMNNVYPLPPDDKKYHITYPIAQYDHDEGNAISGGFEYWGESIPALKGKYVFGDIVNGRLFYIEMNDIKLGSSAPIKEWRIAVNGQLKTLVELCDADKVDVRFGRDHLGELYIMTKPDGKVYRLINARHQNV
ncbi:MAG TPA: PQQ-dependent sugar dehydrogenase [Cyclobacteriaceae bacterium]|nr:PQQ-dependent sugar dehydrogenase [Cyclobacteriaceae bacterium]